MRAVLQRVSRASVTVEGAVVGAIEGGWLVLLGVSRGDTEADASKLAGKIAELRAFEDDAGKLNRDIRQAGGAVLVVSQFTLLADCRKGRRPSFTDAAPPEEARRLYDRVCTELAATGLTVERGVFRTTMTVSLTNEGPVTLLLDTRDGA
jgi:D-tyrosyl-tRNA(Tyr) deacylase